jgi:RNA 3'-terminal phosphate cyclase (ATP)
MIELDGSFGEGGGQILRTALALSLVTGEPFRIARIRAGRSRPGLLRQHLTAVRAAAAVGGAAVEGDHLGSSELAFRPSGVRPGEHRFAIGSAGSGTLVAQTVLPALLLAPEPSTVTVEEGGTHNPAAPPFEFLARGFLPLIERMGPRVDATLERYGFFPRGGGRFTVRVEPVPRLAPLHLDRRGAVRRVSVEAAVAGLPLHIAEREARTAAEVLELPPEALAVRELPPEAGPGNAVMVTVESEHVTEVFSGFGQKGTPAETVARGAANEARAYLEHDVAAGEHLADQLMIPLALAGEGSFSTLPLSSHAETNVEVIRRFLPVDLRAELLGGGRWRVVVG